MPVKIKHYEPAKMPAPLSDDFVIAYRKRLKQLGVSPNVDNGIRGWRVLWRPFLKHPVVTELPGGRVVVRRKSHSVRTKRFPVAAFHSEHEAFREAAIAAAMAYRTPVAEFMPIVDWGRLARAKGVKLRDVYAKPALNGGIDKAAELLEAGYGQQQVAQQLGVDPSTISRWRKRIAKENAQP